MDKEPSIAMLIVKDLKKQRLMLFIANILLAIALIISSVPIENYGSSKTPAGPLANMVLALIKFLA